MRSSTWVSQTTVVDGSYPAKLLELVGDGNILVN
jgi:hypothetical protein